MPTDLAAQVDLVAWQAPAVFGWLASAGNLDDAEMLRTFNCGIGMVVVAEKRRKRMAREAAGEAPLVIGDVIPPTGEVGRGQGKRAAGSRSDRSARARGDGRGRSAKSVR